MPSIECSTTEAEFSTFLSNPPKSTMDTILVCADGSTYASSIYQHAALLANNSGARVHVLHVIERDEARQSSDLTGSIGFDAGEELMEELVKFDEAHSRVARLRGKAILEDAEKQLRAAGVTEVTTTQRHGSVIETLEEFEKDAALVVIGKRGEHSAFARAHLGSNLERVARGAKIPVMTASLEYKPVKRFLIAFDGGASVLKAVDFVANSRMLHGMEAHLVAVGKPGSALERELEHVATGLRGAGFQVKADLVQGDADETISKEVDAREIDLLVMGAYGHGLLRRLVLGSTTTNLLRTCKIPVLLFR